MQDSYRLPARGTICQQTCLCVGKQSIWPAADGSADRHLSHECCLNPPAGWHPYQALTSHDPCCIEAFALSQAERGQAGRSPPTTRDSNPGPASPQAGRQALVTSAAARHRPSGDAVSHSTHGKLSASMEHWQVLR